MNVRDALRAGRAWQQRARYAVWKAETIRRVVVQTGMNKAVRWPGARALARELIRGKSGPSMLFRFHAENNPHGIALISPRSLLAQAGGKRAEDQVYTYREVNDLVDRIGLALRRWGVGPGESALVMLKNRPEFLMIQLGIGRIGGAAVSVSWRSTVPELVYLASHSGAKALFFDAELGNLIGEAAAKLEIPRDHLVAVGGAVDGFPTLAEVTTERGAAPDLSETAAVVMYTSGTTGKPKGAVRSFPRDAIASVVSFIGETPLRAGDVHLAVLPMYHATAFAFISIAFLLGGTVVVLPEFRPDLALDAIQRYGVTSTVMVPTMFHRLLELGEEKIRAYDTSSLRAIFSGGAPLPGPLAIALMDVLGDKLYNFYGATETGTVTIASPEDLRASPGTIGRAVPGVEIRLLDDAGQPVGAGEVGELYVRSKLLIEGYHKDADATSQSMREGFFSVGDLARQDARGCYLIEGRKRDMIISGGVNVYPAEVEEVLHDHPDVVAALTEDDLRAHCRARLAGPKVPRDFVFLEQLPRNPTGKVLKRELTRWEST
jgi:fatty-acyl-CoA synthase